MVQTSKKNKTPASKQSTSASQKDSQPAKKRLSVKSDSLAISNYDVAKKTTVNFEIPKSVFDIKAHDRLLSTYVRVYLSNNRQSSAVTQTRGEVSGSTHKIYRQKGTGRARHGARNAPIFVGGGTAHGPKLRTLKLKMNKKQKTKALLYSLSKQYQHQNILVISNFSEVIKKTKDAQLVLEALSMPSSKICFVYDSHRDNNIQLYFRNIDNVNILAGHSLNAYFVMTGHKIIFTENAIKSLINIRQQPA